MNRAFYGIMSSNLMQNKEGKYTNALYGFLSILFKNIEEVKPDYLLVAFDSKTAANVRKEQYSGYKQSRHKMPEELAEQMPEIKEILKAMKIETLELADFEGDDILGSAAKKYAGASINGDKINCYILSGDRDLFQLVQKDIIVRIPRTKIGKTETDIYDLSKIDEEYGLTPCDLIEVKALQGDSSDEIPGCPGIGPKSAIQIIKEFKTIDNLYDALDGKNEEFAEKVNEDLFLSTVGILQKEVELEKNNQNFLVQKLANLVGTGEDNVSYKRVLDRINKKQLDEIGTDRSREKPINIVSRKIEELELQKNNLEEYQNKKYEITEEENNLIKIQNKMN